MDDKKNVLQSYKDLRVELIKQGANSNSPMTPLDKRRNNKRAGIQKEFSMEICQQENYKTVEKKKNYQDIKFIITCLRNHFVFYNLQDNQLETLVNEMFYCELNENEFIIKEDDNASTFFILEQGRIEVSVKGNVKKDILPGEGFENFTSAQKDSVAGVLIDQKFLKDKVIVSENDPASSFYIIKEGQVSVMKEGSEVRVLQAGDSFGEAALLQGAHKRMMSVKASSDVKCLALGRDVLNRILGDQVEVIIYKNITKWTLERIAGFQGLSSIQKEQILENLVVTHHADGEIIAAKAQLKREKIIVVLEGTVKSGNELSEKGSLFGGQEAFSLNDKSLYDTDVACVSKDGKKCIIGSIKTEKLVGVFGQSLHDLLNKNQQVKEKSRIEEKTLQSHLANMKLSDLICVKKLGFGQFGSVFLVKERGSPNIYGLKCVSKVQVVEQSLEKHIQNEKQVMEFNDFPFVMKFLRSFKDERCIYFLLELIQGSELFDVIREIGLLSTSDSQFYIGSLIVSLEYLHSNHIIYRDIKPENIMVDHTGYLKLIDMGTAKIMKSKAGTLARTFTIIGTPHYMAPEVISGKGYNYLIDLWSIGICLYEFMCGGVPYAEDSEDPYEIYEEIIKKDIIFPNFMKDVGAKQIILQLLNKIPEIRLGGSYNLLKANKWFHNFNWNALNERKIEAPFIPLKQNELTSAFIAQKESQGITIQDQIKADGIAPLSSIKIKNPKYDPRWDEMF